METCYQTFKCFLSLTLFSLFLLTGCGHYSMEKVRFAFEERDFEGALAHLDEGGKGKAKLPYLFERGLITHYANRFDESNQALEIAELISEDLYTKSISKEVASLLTSDNVRPYSGTQYERLLIHYYRALNYVYLDLPDEALVECRRAGQLLQYYADKDPTYKFTGAAFLSYLSGILYEWTGDWNDAYISYRWAEKGYNQYEEHLGVPFPKDVGYALVRLARMLGFSEEAERYAQFYGEPPQPAPGSGELILIYESGFVPQKTEVNIVLPIFTTDKFGSEEEEENDDDDNKKKRNQKRKRKRNKQEDKEIWEFADELTSRRDLQYEKVNLEYLLRVAIPAYTSNRPQLVGVEAQVDNVRVSGVLAEDVQAAALATFAAEQKTILLRTVVRALLKYLGFRRAEKEGELVGRLVNLFNVVTESADTRSWETLPNQIFLVRMSLPPGTHDVTLTFLDNRNQRIRTEILPDVEIQANGKTFLNYRTFE
ncbi:hypothetical protein IH992_29230 [Candidatus Poribacteria bacterium]|nr:hypothetical protein [Candidatus Poribacteria bacterium]